ncbi:ABC transporter C family member 5-like protein [Corchorus capsularis]|uniref:ABC transporter C family member 5-like protein n=1 Tax=Corchorus capsularis TaxID=210143 RepID=A0A1R3IYW8_COCAP|nr:ABC transporter C family member 5-like protein [Corchorus capsularis]
MVALVSTSNTRTKLSREAEAAITPERWAATETTPRQWPVLVRTRSSSSGLQSLTVSSSDPVNSSDGRVVVAGTYVAAQTDSSWAFSTDFRPASFIDFDILPLPPDLADEANHGGRNAGRCRHCSAPRHVKFGHRDKRSSVLLGSLFFKADLIWNTNESREGIACVMVGSGKSSLLSCILGEIPKISDEKPEVKEIVQNQNGRFVGPSDEIKPAAAGSAGGNKKKEKKIWKPGCFSTKESGWSQRAERQEQ